MKFKTQYNAKDYPSIGEINLKPSMTKPDQTFTVQEILNRFAKGLPMTSGKVPMYDDPSNELAHIDISRLDLADIQRLKETINEHVRNLQATIRQDELNAIKAAENAAKEALEKQKAEAKPPAV